VGSVVLRYLLLSLLLSVLLSPAAQAQAVAAPAPPSVQGFLYVEPFVGRYEMVVDLPTALHWVQQSHDPLQIVTPADQLRYRAEFLRSAGDWCSVTQDDEKADVEVRGVTFLKGKGGNLMSVEAEEKLEAPLMQVGITWEFALRGAPERVELRWKHFVPPLRSVPVSIYHGQGRPELAQMHAPLGSARWENKGRLAKPRAASSVPKFLVPEYLQIPVAMLVWLVLGVAIWVWVLSRGLKFPGGITPFLAAWVLGIIVTLQAGYVPLPLPGSQRSEPVTTQKSAEAILQPLLENFYRSFDYRTEAEVKERIQACAVPTLADSLYRRTLKMLTLEGSDGTRARVESVGLSLDEVQVEGDGFRCAAEWAVFANAHHWGHPDQKGARIRARLTLHPQGEEWKLSVVEVLEERVF
jgi:hypothetical protein